MLTGWRVLLLGVVKTVHHVCITIECLAVAYCKLQYFDQTIFQFTCEHADDNFPSQKICVPVVAGIGTRCHRACMFY